MGGEPGRAAALGHREWVETEAVLRSLSWSGIDNRRAGITVPAMSGDDSDEASGQQCPYCGETVELDLDPGGANAEDFVEDCPVCCRPWRVSVVRDAEGNASVSLSREDD
jgi:hypothetical protein